ncbi:hypothetical protein H0E87_026250 [Populus deltoides]|uniref:Secreted protein n=1 Tax=Populus deltoides TaxID=3696 RepID=A0A8T2X238_POPDE|nr:hypothetical protein H0E87_026250 [Populus deltoides]
MFCSLVSFVRPLVFSVFFRFPSFSSVLVLYCSSPLESSGSGAVVAEDGDLAYSESLSRKRKLILCGCGPQKKTTANTQETNRQLLFALLKESRRLARVMML